MLTHPFALPCSPLQSLTLGRDYDSLLLDITAQPQERHPSAAKCTMPSPHAHRHLRHLTGLAALREYEAAAAGDGQLQTIAAPSTADSVFAGKPCGGRVRVLVEARGITSGEVPPPGQPAPPGCKVPTLDITVEGRDLHAPLVERLVELPMDINAGRVRVRQSFRTDLIMAAVGWQHACFAAARGGRETVCLAFRAKQP